MTAFDSEKFSARTSGLSDDELIALVSINAASLIPEALDIARAEIERRGLSADVQPLIFDVFLNSAGGFAGRLILLEEQLMFLSTGMRASGGSGGGLVGAIAGEAHTAARNVSAASLDFSALDNEGSWIYYVDQIEECHAHSSLLSGRELKFKISEEDGSLLDGFVKCNELSKTETERLALQILNARDSLLQKSPTIGGGA